LGLDRLRGFLRRHDRVALDTSIFIYQLESNPRYLPCTDPIFSWLERRGSRAVTSTITMTELLVQPYRLGDEQLADQFYGLLSTYPNLEWVAPNLEIADATARIRAEYRLRTPDALQGATALHASATGLITNDPIFQRVGGFETLVLDELLESK
jgi:predicted nucleic acid-binding protein